MNKNYPFSELKTKIDSAQKILVFLPQKPNFDAVAGALALYLSLIESGKTASITTETSMTVEFNHLVGVNKITSKIQGTDLIVSFNYPPEQIEKVSYNDDNSRPNLVIQPKVGAPPISEDMAVFSYAGLETDLLLAVGVKNESQLTLGGKNLQAATIVNIDNSGDNSQFGQLNLVDTEASSLCEMVLGLIQGLELILNVDTAQNILDGLWRATQGLNNQTVSADTYEAVAICLRLGARRGKDQETRKEEVFTPKKQDKPLSQPPADWFEPKIFKGTNIS